MNGHQFFRLCLVLSLEISLRTRSVRVDGQCVLGMVVGLIVRLWGCILFEQYTCDWFVLVFIRFSLINQQFSFQLIDETNLLSSFQKKTLISFYSSFVFSVVPNNLWFRLIWFANQDSNKHTTPIMQYFFVFLRFEIHANQRSPQC